MGYSAVSGWGVSFVREGVWRVKVNGVGEGDGDRGALVGVVTAMIVHLFRAICCMLLSQQCFFTPFFSTGGLCLCHTSSDLVG